jgi:hypothetical protein
VNDTDPIIYADNFHDAHEYCELAITGRVEEIEDSVLTDTERKKHLTRTGTVENGETTISHFWKKRLIASFTELPDEAWRTDRFRVAIY